MMTNSDLSSWEHPNQAENSRYQSVPVSQDHMKQRIPDAQMNDSTDHSTGRGQRVPGSIKRHKTSDDALRFPFGLTVGAVVGKVKVKSKITGIKDGSETEPFVMDLLPVKPMRAVSGPMDDTDAEPCVIDSVMRKAPAMHELLDDLATIGRDTSPSSSSRGLVATTDQDAFENLMPAVSEDRSIQVQVDARFAGDRSTSLVADFDTSYNHQEEEVPGFLAADDTYMPQMSSSRSCDAFREVPLPPRSSHYDHDGDDNSSNATPWARNGGEHSDTLVPQDDPPPLPNDDIFIEIGAGIQTRLRRTGETMEAIVSGFYAPATCLACSTEVVTITDVEYLACPGCKTISPVAMGGEGGTATHVNGQPIPRRDVGMGITYDTLFKMQSDLVREQEQDVYRQTQAPYQYY